MKCVLRRISVHLLTCASAMLLAVSPAWAGSTLNVYGSGGPAPAMKEAAKTFGALQDVEVNVTAAPTPQWADKAKQDADVI